MYTFLITIIASLFIGFRHKIVTKDSVEWSDRFLLCVFLGIAGGFFIALFIPAKTKEVKHTVYLECLQDVSSVKGSMYLGSGTIEGVWKYSYYVKRNGAYYLESINANGIPVKYTDGEPRIVWYEEVMDDHYLVNKFTFKCNCACEKDGTLIKTIFIPEGTVKKEYKLDAN